MTPRQPAAAICPICYHALVARENAHVLECVNRSCTFERQVPIRELFERSLPTRARWRLMPIRGPVITMIDEVATFTPAMWACLQERGSRA